MTRIRVVVAACLAVGIMLTAPTTSSYGLASRGLTTTFTTDSSSGDGYQATFTINNGTSVTVGQWSVGIVLPAGAQVSNPVGARIAVNGQQVTASNPAGFGRLDPGASAMFSFTVHGGAAPPFVCVTNGQPCPSAPPTQTPSPAPTPTGSPSPTAPAPAPTTPAPAPTTPATTTPPTTTPPATSQPTPPATPAPPTQTPAPTSGPSPTA